MARLTKKDIKTLAEILTEQYPDAGCALDYGTPFQLLCATVLSAQTTDVSVNKVTPELFAKAPDAFSMAKLEPDEIEKIIKRIGLYKSKAKNIKNLSVQLCERFGGEVPEDFDALTSLPGVGRKTANVVLAEAFGQQRIAVDTHVFRLANRIGITNTQTPEKTEEALMKAFPESEWTFMHHALIWHGRRVCSARKPSCENCAIECICKKNGVIQK